MPTAESSLGALDEAAAHRAVEDGTRRYFASRRGRVDWFVDRHFTLRGSLRLHRAALGWDIARAPLNLLLAGPQVAMQAMAGLARKAKRERAAAFLGRTILFRTDVERRIEQLIWTELLELPFAQDAHDRPAGRDALAEAILAGPELAGALAAIGADGQTSGLGTRLDEAMAQYGISRTAAAEITTGLLTLGAGAAALNKLTPGAITLGPALAALWARQAAVAAFPLGGWLGGLWYGLYPAVPSALLVAATTGGLMVAVSGVAAVAGIVSDPVQRMLGLHRARLLRMLGRLEAQALDPAEQGFRVRDHYVARLLDLFDLVGAAMRLARP